MENNKTCYDCEHHKDCNEFWHNNSNPNTYKDCGNFEPKKIKF